VTREEAIQHVLGLSGQVAGEFCVGVREMDLLEAETNEALAALGVTPEEIEAA
jgi:hypothetical protein